jgi:hypothetical protein
VLDPTIRIDAVSTCTKSARDRLLWETSKRQFSSRRILVCPSNSDWTSADWPTGPLHHRNHVLSLDHFSFWGFEGNIRHCPLVHSCFCGGSNAVRKGRVVCAFLAEIFLIEAPAQGSDSAHFLPLHKRFPDEYLNCSRTESRLFSVFLPLASLPYGRGAGFYRLLVTPEKRSDRVGGNTKLPLVLYYSQSGQSRDDLRVPKRGATNTMESPRVPKPTVFLPD